MAGRDVDPERSGLDPSYDYDLVERIALERAEGPGGLSRRQFLVGTAAVLAAAGGPAAALAARAGRAGTINFFSWQGYDIPGVAKPWLKQHGIAFHARYFASNDDIAVAVRQGGGKSPFNLSTYYAGQGPQWRDLKLSAPLDISKVPNVGLLYGLLRSGSLSRWWRFSGQWYGVPFTFGGNTGLYDSASMPEPKSWTEFLKPSWKNRFVIIDDSTATFNMGAHLAGVFNVDFRYTKAQAEKVFDILSKFKKNARTVATYGQVPDLLASGETQGVTASWAAIANQAAAKGKKTIKPFLGREGGSSFIDVWFTPPSSHPDDLPIALGFINFSISPKAQASAAKTLSGGVMTPKAVPLLDPATKALYPYATIAAFFRQAPVTAFPPTKKDGDVVTWSEFNNMWRAFKAS